MGWKGDTGFALKREKRERVGVDGGCGRDVWRSVGRMSREELCLAMYRAGDDLRIVSGWV
jgi:hypothetical protein